MQPPTCSCNVDMMGSADATSGRPIGAAPCPPPRGAAWRRQQRPTWDSTCTRKIVVATALDSGGHELAQQKFGPEPSELIDFLTQLPGRKHVTLEACSMWAPFYDTAASTGAVVTLSNPYKTRLIAEASLKSDKVDSEALARLLRVDSIPTSYAPPPEIRQLRTLVQDRVFYRRYWTAVANHTYHFLIARGIPYEDRLLKFRRKREVLRKLHLPEVNRGLETLLALEERGKELNGLSTVRGSSRRRVSCSPRSRASASSRPWPCRRVSLPH